MGSLGELDLFVVSQAHDHFLLQRGQLRTSGGATPTPTHHELERLAWALHVAAVLAQRFKTCDDDIGAGISDLGLVVARLRISGR